MTNTPPNDSTGTASQFGEEWWRYPEILPIHEDQFLAWIQPIAPAFFSGKTFLDAGCGMGRNSYWPLKYGATSGVAFDFDPRTVATARKNLAPFSTCRVEQFSIYDIPYENQFDIVFCVGVLHHLAQPAQAVAQLVKALKPGGTLILWVYGKEGNALVLFFVNAFRWITRGWSARALIWFSRALTFLMQPFLYAPWKSPYLRFLRGLSFRHREAIVFDQLLPSIAHYWTREEALALVAGFPVHVTNVTHTRGMSWTLVAIKDALFNKGNSGPGRPLNL